MNTFYKYPSIEQFRSIVKQVKSHCDYNNQSYPLLCFEGTVKLHGTNAGVVVTPEGDVYAQSRNNIITPEKDNAGFACFVHSNKETFLKLNPYKNTLEDVVIYGEWCGSGIQKGVAISELDKMFVVFGVKVGDDWLSCDWMEAKDDSIYSIKSFPTYQITIDFNCPEKVQNDLITITEQVEAECPVGKAFGVSGVGEGVVWSCDWKDKHLAFKVKGDKHASSKVKKLASVDVDKINNIQEFVEYSVTDNRLNQAIEQVFTLNNLEPDIKETGDFLRWVIGDIMKEELDTLLAAGLEPKDVNSSISKKAREWFINNLDL